MNTWDAVKETLHGAWRSRVIWLNSATLFAATLLADPGILQWATQEIGKENVVRLFAAIAAVNIVLRFDTDGSLRDKVP
jgi:hypothetical protein